MKVVFKIRLERAFRLQIGDLRNILYRGKDRTEKTKVKTRSSEGVDVSMWIRKA